MSYILKALRKSEAERAKGAVPKLTPHHEPVAPRQGSIWPWVAVAALVVNAVIGGVMLWRSDIMPWLQEMDHGADKPVVAETMPAQVAPTNQAATAAASQVPEPQTNVAPQPAPSTPQQALQSPAESPSAEMPDSAATPVVAAEPQDTETLAERPPAASSEGTAPVKSSAADSEAAGALDTAARVVGAIEQTPSPTVSEARPKPAKALAMAPEPPRKPAQIKNLVALLAATAEQDDPLAEEKPWDEELSGTDVSLADDQPLSPAFASNQAAEPYKGVPMLWQMPRAFRSLLPKLSISVHVYSPEQPGRFVIIDRKKYWEGDNLVDGVVLEAIVPDGVVMAYQGQQFRLSSR